MKMFDDFMDSMAMGTVGRWCVRLMIIFVLIMAVLASIGAARANHTSPEARTIWVQSGCRTLQAAIAIVTTTGLLARRELEKSLARNSICGNLGGVAGRIHEILGTEVWAGDDLGDEMLMFHVIDPYGTSIYTWALKKEYLHFNNRRRQAADLIMISSQAAPQCGQHALVLDYFAQQYKEVPVAIGVTNSGALIELLTTKDGDTWTLHIVTPNGISCFLVAGENWRSLTPVKAPGI